MCARERKRGTGRWGLIMPTSKCVPILFSLFIYLLCDVSCSNFADETTKFQALNEPFILCKQSECESYMSAHNDWIYYYDQLFEFIFPSQNARTVNSVLSVINGIYRILDTRYRVTEFRSCQYKYKHTSPHTHTLDRSLCILLWVIMINDIHFCCCCYFVFADIFHLQLNESKI